MKIDLRIVVVALVCLAVGFLVAERMTPAAAAPVPSAAQDARASIQGTTGAVVVEPGGLPYLVVMRDRTIWRIGLSGSSNAGAVRPWATLAD